MARMPGKFYNFAPNRPQSDRSISGKKILLVEGPDDIYFFNALLVELNAPVEEIQIIDYEGKDRLSAIFSLLIKAPEVESGDVVAIGLVQDADGDLDRAKANIDEAWRAVGLDVAPYGVFSKSKLRKSLSIGSFALPDCKSSGDLDEMLFSSSSNDAAHPLSLSFLDQVGLEPGPKFYKRATQVYLASKPKLSRGAGRGAENGYFDLSSIALSDVKNYIDSLVNV